MLTDNQIVPRDGVTLIHLNGTAYADTRTMAKALNNDHSTVIKLLSDYQGDFEAYGLIRFEIEKVTIGRPGRYALLNEEQCYLLLTFSRNNDVTRALKVKLIQEFASLRRASGDPVELLLKQALEMRQFQLAQESRMATLESDTAVTKAKVEAISGGSGYFTVRGYANLNGVRIPTTVAAQIGRKAGKLARERGCVMRQAIDELYGAVNSYPEEILEAVFEEMGL